MSSALSSSNNNAVEVSGQGLMTVKELSQELAVSDQTIRNTAKLLFKDPSKVLLKVINGGRTMVFTEAQATAIKMKLRERNNLKDNLTLSSSNNTPEISGQELMTTKQLAEQLNTSVKVILENGRKCLPNKVFQNGKTTYWNEKEVTVLLECLKKNSANHASDLYFQSKGSAVTSSTNALRLHNLMTEMQAIYEDELFRVKNELNIEKENRVKAEQKVIELEPDAENWRAVQDSDGTFAMTKIANTLHFKAKDGFLWFSEHEYIAREQNNTGKIGKWLATDKGVKSGLVRNVIWVDKESNHSGLSMKLTADGVSKVIELIKAEVIQKKYF